MPTRFLLFALTASGLFLTAPRSHSQALHNAWFKVTVAPRVVAVDLGTNEVSKGKGKLVAYMNVRVATRQDEGILGEFYEFDLWTEVLPGLWAIGQTGQFFAGGERERVLIGPSPGPENRGIEIELPLGNAEGGETLRVQFVAITKIKLDGQGQRTKAAFRSIGSVIPEGFDGEGLLFGSARVSGRTIPVSKLPFFAKS